LAQGLNNGGIDGLRIPRRIQHDAARGLSARDVLKAGANAGMEISA
jgi:hypothetical protein